MADSETMDFSLRRAGAQGCGVIAADLGLYLGLSLLIVGIPFVALAYWQSIGIDLVRADTMQGKSAGLLTLLYTVRFGNLIASGILMSILVPLTLQRLTGREIGFAQRPAAVLGLALRIFALWLLIAMAIGFVSLFAGFGTAQYLRHANLSDAVPRLAMWFGTSAPSILVWTFWIAAIPAYVQEPLGLFASLRRSSRLTREARAKTLLVITTLMIVTGLLTYAATWLTGQGWRALAGGASVALSAMVFAAMQASIYLELRRASGERTPETLQEIFG